MFTLRLRKMANVKQQLASLANSSGPSQKDRIEKYGVCIANTVRILSFIWLKISVVKATIRALVTVSLLHLM